jgi:biotin carboxyl carrier protein
MRYSVSSGARTAKVEVEENGPTRTVTLDDQTLTVDWQPVGGAMLRAGPGASAGHYSLLIGNRSFEVFVRALEGAAEGGAQTFEVTIAGRPYVVQLEDERARALAGLAGAGHERGEMAIHAPMPGLVANVLAKVGQTVERGQTVVVLEAMKMENDLMAPRSGVVHAVPVTPGQTVSQGDVLAVVGDPEGAPSPADGDEEE